MAAEIPTPWTARQWAGLGDDLGQMAAELERQAAKIREAQALAMKSAEKRL